MGLNFKGIELFLALNLMFVSITSGRRGDAPKGDFHQGEVTRTGRL